MNRSALISVGNELLCGRTVDTNAAWLGGRLFAMGVRTASVHLVADETADIVAALQAAAGQADIVLVTGGLGPTDDDLTRNALAEYLGVELEYHPELAGRIEAFFSTRGLSMPARNRTQAYVPKGAEPIDNPCGTAPGILYQTEHKLIALMPGVPSEMKAMCEASVLPQIRRRLGGPVIRSANLRCYGAGESSIAQMLGDRMRRGRNPLINCTISAGIITLQMIASAPNERQAEFLLAEQRAELEKILGPLVFGTGEQTLQDVLGRLLSAQNKTLAVAESCTGGLVSKLLTDVPGASQYFNFGWVTYSNKAKIEQLEVCPDLIEQFGAVSEPVAKAMAQGAARKARADCAIAITGIAGPSGQTEQKTVGLVYISVLNNEKCQVHRFHFPNAGRELVRLRAAQTALNLLRLELTI